MTAGFVSASFEPIAAVEWDLHAAATYAANFGEDRSPLCRRARDLGDLQLAADGVQPCRPHSNFPLLDHRPARGSSPSFTGLVHGQHPIDG